MNADDRKKAAARRAAELVTDGMRLGLGTGSTAKHFVDAVGAKVKAGMRLLCVPTSEATRAQAESLGIPLTTLDETPALDLTVDGADEFDAQMRLIKGGGAALLREKIVAAASARMIVIADESKRVTTLGRFPLPIEVTPFGLGATLAAIGKAAAAAGCEGELRLRIAGNGMAKGEPVVTDGGHWIVDGHFGAIPDPERLADGLARIPGVMEHGLFIGLATGVVVAGPSGLALLGQV
jgi:ribose 5-phosphate isomerase A